MVEHTTKREQTTLWTLTNETCGPTTKAKTEKYKRKREREGRGKKGENKIKLESEKERRAKLRERQVIQGEREGEREKREGEGKETERKRKGRNKNEKERERDKSRVFFFRFFRVQLFVYSSAVPCCLKPHLLFPVFSSLSLSICLCLLLSLCPVARRWFGPSFLSSCRAFSVAQRKNLSTLLSVSLVLSFFRFMQLSSWRNRNS